MHFFSTRFERFAATAVEADGFGACSPEEPAGVGFDSVLRLSLLKPELTDLFTEVSESI